MADLKKANMQQIKQELKNDQDRTTKWMCVRPKSSHQKPFQKSESLELEEQKGQENRMIGSPDMKVVSPFPLPSLSPSSAGLSQLRTPSGGSASLAIGVTNIMAVVHNKRFIKHLLTRVRKRQRETTARQQLLEPTYQMEPVLKFSSGAVMRVLQHVVDKRMATFVYDPKMAVIMCKCLSEEIKYMVKELKFDRYKIVCIVSIGQKKKQGLRITSRCTWNTNIDDYSTYTWDNINEYCCASVFGVYHE